METLIILILIVFVISIISFLRDRDKSLSENVDKMGGMYKKYKHLVDTLLKDPGSKLIIEERDRLIIECNRSLTKGQYIITEMFDEVEINWTAKVGRIGNERKTWKYRQGTSQDIIIKDIRTYHLSLM